MSLIAYFRCDVGIDHGLGHFSRCLRLAEYLRKNKVKSIFFCNYSSKKFLSKKKYKNIRITYLNVSPFSEKEINFFFKKRNSKKKILFFIDSKKPINRYVKRINDNFFTICFDDEKYRNLPCNILINNNIYADRQKYKTNKLTNYLIGPKYNLVENNINKKKITYKIKNIILTFGGEDPRNSTLFFLKNLKQILKKYKITIIIGPVNKHLKSIKSFLSMNKITHQVIVNPEKIFKYFIKADLAISAGGVTCYELLKLGIPTIGVSLNIGQRKILNNLKRLKCINIMNFKKDKKIINKNNKITREVINNFRIRKDMSKKSKNIFKNNGLKLLTQNILKFFKENECK